MGPVITETSTGAVVPIWQTYVGTEDGEPTGRVYFHHTYEETRKHAYQLAFYYSMPIESTATAE